MMKRSPLRRRAADGASDPTLLSYAIAMSPDPIQTSAPAAEATAVITIAVAPIGTAAAYCDTITIYLLVGPDQAALSATAPTSGVNTPKWTLASSQVSTAEALGLAGDGADQYATFTYNCVSPSDYQIDYPLIFTLTATPNEVPGIFTLNFEENSGTSSDPNGFTPKDVGFPLTKVPFTFFLDNFTTALVTTPKVPCTEFANGVASQIYFQWESNGTSYALFEANSTTSIPIPAGQNFYTLPTGPSVDTTYILQATLTGAGDEADPEASGSQTLYQALTLTISNPDLTPKSVTASGPVSAATLTISGTAGVTGVLTASGGATVTGGVHTDTLNASGAATLVGATLGGALAANAGATVAGGLSADNATVAGTMTTATASITGNLRLPGASNMINGAQAVGFSAAAPTLYTANTDGFLVGFVSQDNASTSAHNTTRMALYSGVLGTWIMAQGGNHCAQIYGDCSWWMGGITGSVTVPVQAGTQFGAWQLNDPNNDDNSASCSCWFVPLGAASPFSSAFALAEAPADVAPPPMLHAAAGKQVQGCATGGKDMIAALKAALQEPGAEALRADFGALVRSVLEPGGAG